MATVVEMPKLGNTVEECLLAAWRKHKGDSVSVGDVIAEIETDKTNFEITAPSGGVVLETFFDEGALVPVFTNLCVIGAPGETIEPYRPASAGAGGDGVVPREGAGTEPAVSAEPEAGTSAQAAPVATPQDARPLSPRARRFAREHDFQPPAIAGSGPGGRVLEADLRDVYYSTPRLTAAARQQAGPDVVPSGPGSGIGGMIRAADLAPAIAQPAAAPQAAAQPRALGEAGAGRISSTRERIAKRLRESLTTTAQYTLNGSANAGGLLAVRKRLKQSAATSEITINDLVVFCTVQALLELPDLNVEFIDGRLHRHADVHVGFACDTDRGLIVPVVHNCQDLSLIGLSRRMKELAAQAVKGTIAVDDMNGGTFTVSNLGSLGIESFTPILNPPQVAILGVDAIQLKAVRNRSGNIEFVDSIGLSLTLDHQIVDGAPGARFLKVIKDKIENVESLCTI